MSGSGPGGVRPPVSLLVQPENIPSDGHRCEVSTGRQFYPWPSPERLLSEQREIITLITRNQQIDAVSVCEENGEKKLQYLITGRGRESSFSLDKPLPESGACDPHFAHADWPDPSLIADKRQKIIQSLSSLPQKPSTVSLCKGEDGLEQLEINGSGLRAGIDDLLPEQMKKQAALSFFRTELAAQIPFRVLNDSLDEQIRILQEFKNELKSRSFPSELYLFKDEVVHTLAWLVLGTAVGAMATFGFGTDKADDWWHSLSTLGKDLDETRAFKQGVYNHLLHLVDHPDSGCAGAVIPSPDGRPSFNRERWKSDVRMGGFLLYLLAHPLLIQALYRMGSHGPVDRLDLNKTVMPTDMAARAPSADDVARFQKAQALPLRKLQDECTKISAENGDLFVQSAKKQETLYGLVGDILKSLGEKDGVVKKLSSNQMSQAAAHYVARRKKGSVGNFISEAIMESGPAQWAAGILGVVIGFGPGMRWAKSKMEGARGHVRASHDRNQTREAAVRRAQELFIQYHAEGKLSCNENYVRQVKSKYLWSLAEASSSGGDQAQKTPSLFSWAGPASVMAPKPDAATKGVSPLSPAAQEQVASMAQDSASELPLAKAAGDYEPLPAQGTKAGVAPASNKKLPLAPGHVTPSAGAGAPQKGPLSSRTKPNLRRTPVARPSWLKVVNGGEAPVVAQEANAAKNARGFSRVAVGVSAAFFALDLLSVWRREKFKKEIMDVYEPQFLMEVKSELTRLQGNPEKLLAYVQQLPGFPVNLFEFHLRDYPEAQVYLLEHREKLLLGKLNPYDTEGVAGLFLLFGRAPLAPRPDWRVQRALEGIRHYSLDPVVLEMEALEKANDRHGQEALMNKLIAQSIKLPLGAFQFILDQDLRRKALGHLGFEDEGRKIFHGHDDIHFIRELLSRNRHLDESEKEQIRNIVCLYPDHDLLTKKYEEALRQFPRDKWPYFEKGQDGIPVYKGTTIPVKAGEGILTTDDARKTDFPSFLVQ